MKSKVLSLVLLAIVFLFVLGCNGGQSIKAEDFTDELETTSLDSTNTAAKDEESEIIKSDSIAYEQTESLSAFESLSYVSTKPYVPQQF